VKTRQYSIPAEDTPFVISVERMTSWMGMQRLNHTISINYTMKTGIQGFAAGLKTIE
jgi:hypothetical protein